VAFQTANVAVAGRATAFGIDTELEARQSRLSVAAGVRWLSVRESWRTWAGGSAAFASVFWFLRQPVTVLRHISGSSYQYSLAPARILATGSHALYSLTLQAGVLNSYLGGTAASAGDGVSWDRPPIEALLLVPLSGFSLQTSHLIFTLITLACVAAAAWLLFHDVLPRTYSRKLRAVITGVTVCSVPAAAGLWGMFAPMLLLPAVAAFIFSERKKNLAAGLCLGVILLMRPQLVWALPILALGARQWRLLAGLCAGGVGLVVSTVLILGPAHVMDWPAAMLQADVQGSQIYTFGIPGWIGYTLSSPASAYISFAVLVVLVGMGAWRYGAKLASHPGLLVAGGLALSLATSPHVMVWNFVLLALPLCVWARSHPQLAVVTALVIDLIQILTFGDYGPPIQYWIAVVPLAVLAALWVPGVFSRRTAETVSQGRQVAVRLIPEP
jgi:Glycosyltransferase family 87